MNSDNIDIAAFSYESWIRFFFAPDEGHGTISRSHVMNELFIEIGDPARVLEYLVTMNSELDRLGERYSSNEVDDGLWVMFGPPFELGKVLFVSSIPLSERVRCLESIYSVYVNEVSGLDSDIKETFYWMWWDMISHTLWGRVNQRWANLKRRQVWLYKTDVTLLDDDERKIFDEIFTTLSRMLTIDDWGCQQCALHGLADLRHPGSAPAIEHFLHGQGPRVREQDREWIKESLKEPGDSVVWPFPERS
jgi:hypothetical protein